MHLIWKSKRMVKLRVYYMASIAYNCFCFVNCTARVKAMKLRLSGQLRTIKTLQKQLSETVGALEGSFHSYLYIFTDRQTEFVVHATNIKISLYYYIHV